jgi:FAD/FMN-containing dehydrogenase
VWTDPAATDANVRWTSETHAANQPHLSASSRHNYLGDDQGDDAIRAAYGPNYERLREIKRRYDPGNVFHLNHNIAP